ncbi:hypothetical protein [uncultured Bilophila sp.]|nr:hypothetical protein [uncultured Bilophila sp.]
MLIKDEACSPKAILKMCSSFQKKGIRLQRFLYLFLRGTRLDIDFYGVVWRYQFAFIVAPLKVPTNSAKLPDQGAGAEKMVDSLIKHFRFPLTVMCSAKFQRGCFPANSLWIKEERERERERENPFKESRKKGGKPEKKPAWAYPCGLWGRPPRRRGAKSSKTAFNRKRDDEYLSSSGGYPQTIRRYASGASE